MLPHYDFVLPDGKSPSPTHHEHPLGPEAMAYYGLVAKHDSAEMDAWHAIPNVEKDEIVRRGMYRVIPVAHRVLAIHPLQPWAPPAPKKFGDLLAEAGPANWDTKFPYLSDEMVLEDKWYNDELRKVAAASENPKAAVAEHIRQQIIGRWDYKPEAYQAQMHPEVEHRVELMLNHLGLA